jgi:hypothetical protein
MPRLSKGARLYKRHARFKGRKLVSQAVWIIRDGKHDFATGCIGSPAETKPPPEAEQALAEYIARKYQPARRHRDIEEIDCADVLSIYFSDVGEPGDQFEIAARDVFATSGRRSVGHLDFNCPSPTSTRTIVSGPL